MWQFEDIYRGQNFVGGSYMPILVENVSLTSEQFRIIVSDRKTPQNRTEVIMLGWELSHMKKEEYRKKLRSKCS
jgi:hypothetical protein